MAYYPGVPYYSGFPYQGPQHIPPQGFEMRRKKKKNQFDRGWEKKERQQSKRPQFGYGYPGMPFPMGQPPFMGYSMAPPGRQYPMGPPPPPPEGYYSHSPPRRMTTRRVAPELYYMGGNNEASPQGRRTEPDITLLEEYDLPRAERPSGRNSNQGFSYYTGTGAPPRGAPLQGQYNGFVSPAPAPREPNPQRVPRPRRTGSAPPRDMYYEAAEASPRRGYTGRHYYEEPMMSPGGNAGGYYYVEETEGYPAGEQPGPFYPPEFGY